MLPTISLKNDLIIKAINVQNVMIAVNKDNWEAFKNKQ